MDRSYEPTIRRATRTFNWRKFFCAMRLFGTPAPDECVAFEGDCKLTKRSREFVVYSETCLLIWLNNVNVALLYNSIICPAYVGSRIVPRLSSEASQSF